MSWQETKTLLVVAILLLGAGTGHRWTPVSRATVAATYRPLAIPLADLPAQIGKYVQTRSVSLASNVVRVAGVDHFVSREYVDQRTGAKAFVYVGYWGRENVGMGHGPEVCFPAAGWESNGRTSYRTVRFRQGPESLTDTDIAIHHFVRNEPEGLERIAVGFVAVAAGRFQPSSRGVFWHRPRPGPSGSFLAHIGVMMPIRDAGWEESDVRIVSLMTALLPEVSKCLFGRLSGPPERTKVGTTDS